MIEVKGKENISAKIIAHSVSESGKEIITYELEYPRFIHAEFMTHRMISKNSASSRAIPVSKMIENIGKAPAMPVFWGKNQTGMQAKEECTELVNWGFADHWGTAKDCWIVAAADAAHFAERLAAAGYHKQIVNRLLEPFQMMKVVATATEWDNFFYLRRHKDAQPEIQELANVMYEAKKQSTPELLFAGEWHTPYVEHERTEDGLKYITYQEDGCGFYTTYNNALKISASCCAQVSYRKNDDSLEKALDIYEKLVGMKPVHASPFEHQATPMGETTNFFSDGVTHVTPNMSLWSGNFKEWIQHRQLIKDHVCNEYKE